MKPKFTLLPLILSTILLIGGCKKDPCKDVSCLNGASCADGTCICLAGFEGADCGVETRAKFYGTYNANESCAQSGNGTYQVTVSSSSAGPTSLILNLAGINISATASGNNLTIPTQQVSVQGTAITFSGSGQLSGNILTLTYTLSGPGGSDTCTATCTKI